MQVSQPTQVRAKLRGTDPESNWAKRICNPVHNRFAIAPFTLTKKGSMVCFPYRIWSGKRDLELATSTLARLRSTN